MTSGTQGPTGPRGPAGGAPTPRDVSRGDATQRAGRIDGPVTPPARERPPVPPRPNSDDSPSTTSGGQPRLPRWAMWLIFLVLLGIWNLVIFLPANGPSSAAIPYSEFVVQATRGNVASVQFKGQGVAGSFVQAILWSPPGGAQPSPGASAGDGVSASGTARAVATGSGN